MIEIHNLKKTKISKPYDVLIDRNSALGNIFYMKDESERDTVCDKYEEWFKHTVLQSKQVSSYSELQRLLSILKKYGQIRLFCWCAPKRCHGETIQKWLGENYSLF